MNTPLVIGAGTDPWAGNNANNANATINGFVAGAAASQITGLAMNALALNNTAFWLYDFTGGAEGNNAWLFGAFNGADSIAGLSAPVGGGTNLVVQAWSNANLSTIVTARPAGLYVLERNAATDLRVWFFNSTNPIAQFGATNANAEGAQSAVTIDVGGLNNNGVHALPTGHTISFWAATTAMSQANKATFASLIQALRVAIGGGFV